MSNIIKQIIMKDKKVVCTTTIPYPTEIIREMKRDGYKVVNVKDEDKENT